MTMKWKCTRLSDSTIDTYASGRLRSFVFPTPAAIEATETYRQAHRLGRGGGITNGWEFWKPRT